MLLNEELYSQMAQLWVDQRGPYDKAGFFEAVKKTIYILAERELAKLRESKGMNGDFEVVHIEGLRFRAISSGRTKPKTVANKVKPQAVKIDKEDQIDEAPSKVKRNTHLTKEQIDTLTSSDFINAAEKEYLKCLVTKYPGVFAFNDNEKGRLDNKMYPDVRIYTIPHTPWKQGTTRYGVQEEREVIQLLKKKIASGVLEVCSGPYANRWFVIRKKDGSLRFISDFQTLNKHTVRDVAEPPHVHRFAEAAAGCNIYSLLDCYCGFEQFGLDIRDRDLTGMNTPLGLLRHTTLPQGFTNAVAEFQRAMRHILFDFLPDTADVFVDDIVVKGLKEDDGLVDTYGRRSFVMKHFEDLEKILIKLDKANLAINGKKCFLGVSKINVVGFVCDKSGRSLNDTFVKKVVDWEPLKDIKEVRSFLGFCRVYQMFVKDFAHIAQPLNLLTRRDVEFKWGEEEQRSFQMLKTAMTTAPVLAPMDTTEGDELVVSTDASDIGIGAVLEVRSTDGIVRPMGYESKTFNKTEKAYHINKKELYAVKHALKKFRAHLFGRKFTLKIDSTNAASWIRNADIDDPTLGRWIAEIKCFDFDICVIRGESNHVADALSRNPCLEVETPSDLQEINLLDVPAEYQDIVRYLINGSIPDEFTRDQKRNFVQKCKKYLWSDDQLFRLGKHPKDPPKWVVFRQEDKDAIMLELHSGFCGGHKGVLNTQRKASRLVHWSGMWQDIESSVKACQECQRFDSLKKKEPLVPSFPSDVWYKVHVDLVHMPPGRGGFKYFINVRDDLSGFCVAGPLRTKGTAEVTAFLKKTFTKFGYPKQLVGDGGELRDTELREVIARLGVQTAITSPYHPQANGVVERGHQEIIKALERWLGEERCGLWPEYIDFAIMAGNMTVKSSTKQTPFFMMYGREPDLALHVGVPTLTRDSSTLTREDLVLGRLAELVRREETIEDSVEHLRSARIRSEIAWNRDRNVRTERFQPGDLVLRDEVKTAVLFPKFTAHWSGPYVVRRELGNGCYYIDEQDGAEIQSKVNGRRLKKYIPAVDIGVEEGRDVAPID